MRIKIGICEIELVEGDITELETDAIVNAANTQLVLGAGVAGAIRRKGGPTIQQECDKIGRISVGQAVSTGGGALKASHVIHAVGPRMGEGQEKEKLENATLNALKLADDQHLASIALPAISTGIYGFPIMNCAEIMLATAASYAKEAKYLKRITFCLFGMDSFNVFKQHLEGLMT
jgi:O-acetyl-ADP-ribose deacetylase